MGILRLIAHCGWAANGPNKQKSKPNGLTNQSFEAQSGDKNICSKPDGHVINGIGLAQGRGPLPLPPTVID